MSVKKFNDSTESNRPTPETDLETIYCDAIPDMPWVDVEVARRLEQERDEAREDLSAMVDIAFKHFTSLLRDAAGEEETQEVIATLKLWKEMNQ